MSPCGRCVLCIEGGERTQGREQLWGLRLEIKHLRVFGSQRKLERCTIPGFKNLCFTFLTFRARPGARGAVMTAQTISDALDVQDLQPRQKQVCGRCNAKSRQIKQIHPAQRYQTGTSGYERLTLLIALARAAPGFARQKRLASV